MADSVSYFALKQRHRAFHSLRHVSMPWARPHPTPTAPFPTDPNRMKQSDSDAFFAQGINGLAKSAREARDILPADSTFAALSESLRFGREVPLTQAAIDAGHQRSEESGELK